MAVAMALLLALPAGALAAAGAGAYAGAVVATRVQAIYAPRDGTLERLTLRVGMVIQAGDAVAAYQTVRAFAARSGVVTMISEAQGDAGAQGPLLSIEPISKYTIYATVAYAYQSPDTTFVRAGETVYLACSTDGSHRGTGVITSIDGGEYRIMVLGGEFYVGETVNIFRDAGYGTQQRIGKGTLIDSEATSYEASGEVVAVHVSLGERVERGELLYETVASSEDGETDLAVYCRCAGIVTAVNVQAGAQVKAGDVLASVARADSLRVSVEVAESGLAAFQEGAAALVRFAATGDAEYLGEIESISRRAQEGVFEVLVRVDEAPTLRIGMTAEVVP